MGKGIDGDEEPLTTKPASPKIAKSEWKSLFNFFSRQHLPVLIVALVLSTGAGVSGPVLAYFFGKIFDSFSNYGSGAANGDTLMRKVSRDAIALSVLGGTIWLAKGGYFALWMVFGELQAKNARDLLFQNLLEKDFEWYEMRTSGIGALLPRLQTWATPCRFLAVTDGVTARFVNCK
jgi:ATP-binding cassette, subfamily B (MDR/TAP), member 1